MVRHVRNAQPMPVAAVKATRRLPVTVDIVTPAPRALRGRLIPPVVAQHSNVMPDITKVVLCVKNARMAEQVLRAQRRNRNVLFTRVRRKAT